MLQSIENTVAEILSLFSRFGSDDYIGEPVSQLQHAAQCADLAAAQGHSVETIVAALLHDVGHLVGQHTGAARMSAFGVANHETIGAQYLRERGFSEQVVQLVQGHVSAKRYLTHRKPDYHATLSAASKRTLEYQGGPMTEDEALAFEADPRAALILTLRRWDEAAKAAFIPAPSLDRYAALLSSHLLAQAHATTPISAAQLAHWRDHGWLKLDGYLDSTACTLLQQWVDDLQQRPEAPGKWMKYFEPSSTTGDADNTRMLCRVENFVQFHPGLAELVDGPSMHAMVETLFGEAAALFKEKINFKLPGGAGFAPHQDAPAFTSFPANLHITVMVSVDASTVANGCLEIAQHPGGSTVLPTAPDLTIDPGTIAQLQWAPIPTKPGDLLFFDSYLPHRSAVNRTDAPRRALYLTYNKAAQGHYRDAYYMRKRAVFPPDVEREQGKSYGDAGVFNVGNPIR